MEETQPEFAERQGGPSFGQVAIYPVPFVCYTLNPKDITLAEYCNVQQSLQQLAEQSGLLRCPSCGGTVEQQPAPYEVVRQLAEASGMLVLTETIAQESAAERSAAELFDFFDVAGLLVDGTIFRRRDAAALTDILSGQPASIELQQQSFALPLSDEQHVLLQDLLSSSEPACRVWHFATRSTPGSLIYSFSARYRCRTCGLATATSAGEPLLEADGSVHPVSELLGMRQEQVAALLARPLLSGRGEAAFCRLILQTFEQLDLAYLALDRPLATLSATESVRLQLAQVQISGFQGLTLFVPELLPLVTEQRGAARFLERFAEQPGRTLQVWMPESPGQSVATGELLEPPDFHERASRIDSLMPQGKRKKEYGQERFHISGRGLAEQTLAISPGTIVHIAGVGAAGKSTLVQAIAAGSTDAKAQRAWKRFEIFEPRFIRRSKTLGEATRLHTLAAGCYAQTDAARTAGLGRQELEGVLSGSSLQESSAIQFGGISITDFNTTSIARLFDAFWEFEGPGDVLALLLAAGGGAETPGMSLEQLPPEFAGIADMLALMSHYTFLASNADRTLRRTAMVADGILDRLSPRARELFVSYFRELSARGMTIFICSGRSVFAAACDSVVHVENTPDEQGEPVLLVCRQ